MKSECLTFLRAPQDYVRQATARQWTAFLQEARQHALLGSFSYLLHDLQLWQSIPAKVQAHLLSGQHYADKQKITLVNELMELEQVFADCDLQLLLVKGVAYRTDGYQFARGRVFSDIDLLVPDSHFDIALKKLVDAGYLEFALSAYDRRYYTRWTHQHPPLTHFLRGANIDLHHHIFPVASGEDILVGPIVAAAVRLEGSVFSVPAPQHLFVHAAVHLFYQEETHKLIKDLFDLYLLYQECLSRCPVSAIIQAACDCQAQAAVYYAIETLHQLFGLPLPAELATLAPATSQYRRWQMQFLLRHLLDTDSLWHKPAHLCWFVRGHLLKMGPATLLYHTVAKAIEQHKERKMLSKKQQEMDARHRPGDAH